MVQRARLENVSISERPRCDGVTDVEFAFLSQASKTTPTTYPGQWIPSNHWLLE
uniref:Uncharacterized protein n=1 Tax=Bionectria ochroleuca TaxID=29856 RepID=A0A8H7TV12_BIOOC